MKSHFRFNKQERSGIFYLLLILVGVQAAYFLIGAKPFVVNSKFQIDYLEQSKLDSLKKVVMSQPQIYTFNPNYISDYKAYSLGLSVDQLDRLLEFREQGKFVNSAVEFQKVTQVSDSLLGKLSPYFKFPEWTKQRLTSNRKREVSVIFDLNMATKEDLKKVNGVGEKLSKRIIKFRDRLGGFLVNEQLNDVYGLKPEVVQRVLLGFQVKQPPLVEKININTAGVEELSKLAYINYELARQIVQYREQKGPFTSLDQLRDVTSFPTERIARITLYLAL